MHPLRSPECGQWPAWLLPWDARLRWTVLLATFLALLALLGLLALLLATFLTMLTTFLTMLATCIGWIRRRSQARGPSTSPNRSLSRSKAQRRTIPLPKLSMPRPLHPQLRQRTGGGDDPARGIAAGGDDLRAQCREGQDVGARGPGASDVAVARGRGRPDRPHALSLLKRVSGWVFRCD